MHITNDIVICMESIHGMYVRLEKILKLKKNPDYDSLCKLEKILKWYFYESTSEYSSTEYLSTNLHIQIQIEIYINHSYQQ